MKSHPQIFQQDLLHLTDLLIIFRKRRWALIGSIVIVVLSTVYFTWKQVPIYMASTRIYISHNLEKTLLPDYRPNYTAYITNERNLLTQIHILKSFPILSRVVKRLKLADEAEDPQKFHAIVSDLSNQVTIKRIEDTDLLKISVSSDNPVEARDIANTLAKIYQQQNIEKSREYSRNAISWLTEQLADLKGKLEHSEKVLLDYQEQETPVILDENVSGKSVELLDGFLLVQTEAIETSATIDSLKRVLKEGKDVPATHVFLNSDIVTSLNAKIVDAELRLQEYSQRYLQKHPKIQKQQQEIQALQQRLLDEIRKILKGLEIRNEILQTRMQNLEKVIQHQEQEAIRNNRKQIQYSILKRDAETTQELYNVMVKKLKEVDISAEISESIIDIIEEAETPTYPFYPKKTINLLIGLGAGIFFGVGLVLLLEYMDRTIKSADEASSYLGLPVLASLPHMKSIPRSGKASILSIQEEGSTSKEAEAFRTLRTNIKFSTIHQKTRNFLITSTNPKEGKSFISVNLGMSFAKTNMKTLLVDTDLRKPILHKYLDIQSTRGITNYLVGEVEDIQDVIVPTKVENLWLLPCGPKPPNPAELLESERMKQLIPHLNSLFDQVIFDSSPVGSVVDASILGTSVDAVLFIVYAGKTDKVHVRQAMNQLEKVQAKICGLVINGIDLKSVGYKYYYYYGYGYGYGYGQDDTIETAAERSSKKNV